VQLTVADIIQRALEHNLGALLSEERCMQEAPAGWR
jgi:hypothetical protein